MVTFALSFSMAWALLGTVQEAPAEAATKPAVQQAQKQGPPGDRPGAKRKLNMDAFDPPTGPMRVLLMSIIENRVRARIAGGPEKTNMIQSSRLAKKSSMRLQFKLTGERLGQMVRAGKFIVEEVIDETGKSLVIPNAYRPRDLHATTPMYSVDRLFRQGFLPRGAEVQAPARAATKLAKIRGYVNVVYGSETEDIAIPNPLQYQGATIENARLKELGIEIYVLGPDELPKNLQPGDGIALRITAESDKIREIKFYDDWFREITARGRQERGQGERGFQYYALGSGRADQDMQMSVTAYPTIEKQKVEYAEENVELP